MKHNLNYFFGFSNNVFSLIKQALQYEVEIDVFAGWSRTTNT